MIGGSWTQQGAPSAPRPPVRIGVLGPISMTIDGRDVSIERDQVRRGFALLVAHQGRATRDLMTDELWPDSLPENPKRALQVVVSRMRKTLGDQSSSLKTTPYDLSLTVTSDLYDFERLVANAAGTTGDERVALLEAAVAQWRGEPFADTTQGGVLEQKSSELRERRRSVLTDLGAALHDQGNHERVIQLLGTEAASAPHDERLAVVLARALASSGRRSDALAVLERTRLDLRDTLGVGLSDLARSTERDILESSVQIPDIQRPPDTPSHFVGRAAELAELTNTARSGESVLIVGEPGVGRTALLRRLQGRLAEHGRISIRATAQRTGAPLDTIATLTSQLLDRAGQTKLSAAETEAISRVLPGHPLAATTPATSTRDEFVSSLASLLVHLANATDAVLMVDDLHLIDAMSHEVVEQVITMHVPVIATSLVSAEHARTGASMHRHQLSGLSRDDVRVLVGLRYGAHLSPDIDALLRRSGGNPSFINLMIDLDLDGELDSDELPTSLLVAVQERLSSLSSSVLETLQTAALIGSRFELDLLRALRPTADRDLDDAQAAHLVRLSDDGTIGRFDHGLVVDGVLELMPSGSMLALHDALGRTLETFGEHRVRVARHFLAAARLDPVRAVVAQRDAAAELVKSHALDDALVHLRQALELVETHRLFETAAHVELLVSLSGAQRLAGLSEHVATGFIAVDLARRNGSADLLARAVIELASHGAATIAGHTDSEIADLIEEALAAEPSTPVAAALMAAASPLLSLTPDYERGQRLFEQADHIAQALGQRELTAQVLSHTHLGYSRPDQFELRLDARRRLLHAAGDDADLQWESAYLAFWEGFVLAEPEHMLHGLQLMRDLTPLAAHRRLSLLHTECAHLTVIGAFDAAEAALNDALVHSRQLLTETMSTAHYGSLLLAIRAGQGRLHELDHGIADIAARLPGYTNLRPAVALVAAESGRAEDAGRLLDELAADDFGSLTFDVSWTAAVWGLSRVAAICGRVDHAARLYELLSPYAGTMSWAGTTTFGPVDRALADLAELLGRQGAAAVHREVAATIADGFSELRDAVSR